MKGKVNGGQLCAERGDHFRGDFPPGSLVTAALIVQKLLPSCGPATLSLIILLSPNGEQSSNGQKSADNRFFTELEMPEKLIFQASLFL